MTGAPAGAGERSTPSAAARVGVVLLGAASWAIAGFLGVLGYLAGGIAGAGPLVETVLVCWVGSAFFAGAPFAAARTFLGGSRRRGLVTAAAVSLVWFAAGVALTLGAG